MGEDGETPSLAFAKDGFIFNMKKHLTLLLYILNIFIVAHIT